MAGTCQKCNQAIAEHGGGHANGCPRGLRRPFNRKAEEEWQEGFNNASVGRHATGKSASYQLGVAAFSHSGAPRTKRKNRPQP